MKQNNKLGMNRTGIDSSPLLSKAMQESTEELTLLLYPPGNDQALAENRIVSAQNSERVGSVPLPATFKGVLTTGVQMLKGSNPTLLIDKLGERLAFERSGVRLYDALISKFRAHESSLSGVATFQRLDEIRNEEHRHSLLVANVMRQLGADPTAVTPSADIIGLASAGIVKVLVEPRVDFIQSLESILVAELTDNDCWGLLIQLVDQAGLEDISLEFRNAYEREQQHLDTIRDWIQQFRLGQVTAEKKIA